MTQKTEYAISVQVEAYLAQDPKAREIALLEPRILSAFRVAASQPTSRDRWHVYESLKDVRQEILASSSQRSALAQRKAYEAYIRAIDALLPDPPSLDDVEEYQYAEPLELEDLNEDE